MSESKALVLAFTVFGLVVAAAYVGLTVAHAKDEVLLAALFVIACSGAHILSRIVMHYAPPEERRR